MLTRSGLVKILVLTVVLLTAYYAFYPFYPPVWMERIGEFRENQAQIRSERYLFPETPSNPTFISYEFMLTTLFEEGYRDEVLFRMVCHPSFEPPWLAGIRKVDSSYEAFTLQLDRGLAGAWLRDLHESGHLEGLSPLVRGTTNFFESLREKAPADFTDIQVTQTFAAIDAETAEALARLWSNMLLNTRYSRKRESGIFDGASYTFSMTVPDYGFVSGSGFPVSDESRVGLLALLGEQLRGYIKSTEPERDLHLRMLKKSTQKLSNQL